MREVKVWAMGKGMGFRKLEDEKRVSHRVVFSFPEVRWQFTKPNEVPLNMKETPTAPLFPVRTRKRRKLKRDHIKRNPNCPLSLQTAE